ncbi:MAG: hypothetical protein ACLQDQ_01215 [Myxococcaceae bacterium]
MNVVVTVTVTGTLPVVSGVTGPGYGLMERLDAPVTFQASVTAPPPGSTLEGVAVKLMMVGTSRPTVTEQLLVLVPSKFVAVSVNVVGVVTCTVVLPVVTGDTGPTLGAMDKLVAPATFQDSLTWPPPEGTFDGLHVKLVMVGVPMPPVPQLHPPNAITESNAMSTVRVGTICIPPQ